MKKFIIMIIIILVLNMRQPVSSAPTEDWDLVNSCDDENFGANIFKCKFNPNGTLIAMVYFTDGEIGRIVDTDLNLKKRLYSESEDGRAINLGWSRDGTMLAVTGWVDGKAWDDIYIYNAETGDTIIEKKGWMFDEAKVKSCLDFNINSSYLAIGGSTSTNKGIVEIFDMISGTQSYTFYIYGKDSDLKSRVSSIKFTPDGKYLFTGDITGNLTIWSTNNWEMIKQIQAHDDIIADIVFNPDGNYFATASHDKKIKIWRTSDWENIKILTDSKFKIYTLAWSIDGEWLASGSQNDDHSYPFSGEILIWNTQIWTKALEYQEEDYYGISIVDWNPSNNQLMVGTTDSELKLFNVVANIKKEDVQNGNGEDDKNRNDEKMDFNISLYLIIPGIILVLIIFIYIIKRKKDIKASSQPQSGFQQHYQPQEQQYPQQISLCPHCNNYVQYIQKHQKWFCYDCKKYL